MNFKKGDYVRIIYHPKVYYKRGQLHQIAKIEEIDFSIEYPYYVRFISGQLKDQREIFDDKCLEIIPSDEAMVEEI